MLKYIYEFSFLIGIDPFWPLILVLLLLLLGVVKCAYPWQPKWKSETKKDKDGKEVTKYYHLGD